MRFIRLTGATEWQATPDDLWINVDAITFVKPYNYQGSSHPFASFIGLMSHGGYGVFVTATPEEVLVEIEAASEKKETV